MKKTKKLLSLLLAFVIIVSTNCTVFASSVTPQIVDNDAEFASDDYVCINGNRYSLDEFASLLNETTCENSLVEKNNTSPQSAAAATVVAVYAVPGLGEVVLLSTGAILIGTVIYQVGSAVYDIFTNWLHSSAKQEAQDAANSVSNRVKVKGSNDVIDLDQFKDKNGKTPKNKNSGTFTSTKDNRYTIGKDTAGHTGYDGTTKVWKLFLSGKRVASLNANGKIVGK